MTGAPHLRAQCQIDRGRQSAQGHDWLREQLPDHRFGGRLRKLVGLLQHPPVKQNRRVISRALIRSFETAQDCRAIWLIGRMLDEGARAIAQLADGRLISGHNDANSLNNQLVIGEFVTTFGGHNH